jgi:exosortase A
MSQAHTAPALRREGLAALTPVLPAVCLALAVLAALFAGEIGAATRVWSTSTAYGHCWLVLPIAVWLIYERRTDAASVPAAPVYWPVLLGVPVALLWMAADVLGVMEGRQIAAVAFVELALLAALGVRLYWVLSAAFLYLIFLVPFGAFLTPALQDFTAAFVARGLDLLDVPNRVTQFQIEIPEGNFYVAEACAGLRFLIASIAFGALYAVTMFRSPVRRAIFIAIACVVPVIANGFRGLGIVLLGHVLGSAEAAATDHVLYGWIFFSIVILALALAGVPFRQDHALVHGPAAEPLPGTARRAVLAVLPLLGVAALGPGAALALDAGAGAPPLAARVLVAPSGCVAAGEWPAGAVLIQRFACGEAHITARTEMLAARANPSRVVRAGADWVASMVPGHDVDNRTLEIAGSPPVTWHLTIDTESTRAAASLLFVDGRPALGGLRDRLHLAQGLLGVAGAPRVAVAVAISEGDPESLRRFLLGQGDLLGRVAKR